MIAALNPERLHGRRSPRPQQGAADPTCSGPIPEARPGRRAGLARRASTATGSVSGLFTDYHYYGAGDIGGAPSEASVRLMEAIVTKGRHSATRPLEWITARYPQLPEPLPQREPVKVGDGPVRVVAATAEQMFLDIKPGQAASCPATRAICC